jgi:hypothetical protein
MTLYLFTSYFFHPLLFGLGINKIKQQMTTRKSLHKRANSLPVSHVVIAPKESRKLSDACIHTNRDVENVQNIGDMLTDVVADGV